MIRKQIYLDGQQNRRLRQVSQDCWGLSEAEIVRRALARFFSTAEIVETRQRAWRQVVDFMQQWVAQDVAPGQHDWQRADLYAARIERYGGGKNGGVNQC